MYLCVREARGKPPCGSQMPVRVITDPLQNEENRGNLQAFWLSQTKSVSRTILDSEMKIMRGAHLDKWMGASKMTGVVSKRLFWPLKTVSVYL